MPVVFQELDGGGTKILLSGRIDMPMSVAGGSRRAVVVDLSQVEFMASLGLRSVVLCGKAVMSKGGKAVLLSPQPAVEEVIVTSGIDELFAIYRDEESAIAAVKPGAA